MRAVRHLHVVPSTAPPAPTSTSAPRWRLNRAKLFVALTLALAVAVRLVAPSSSVHRGLTALGTDARVDLYKRTMENVRLCRAQTTDDLKSFCQQQAELVIAFSECERGCQGLARAVLGAHDRSGAVAGSRFNAGTSPTLRAPPTDVR